MLTPDYQEFANRARRRRRDNTVICGFRTREAVEITQALRDCHAKPARKRNFWGEIARNGRRQLEGRRTGELTGSSCALDHRQVFRTLFDDLVDDTEIAGHLGGQELVALQRVLDR